MYSIEQVESDLELVGPANDPLLLPLLKAPDAATRERELSDLLMDVVQPLIAAGVRRHERFGRLQGEDLGAIVMLRVIARLDELTSGAGEPIERLREYVARLARNAASDVLRSRYPEHRRLQRRIRAVLARDERFALWPSSNGLLCGFRAWKGMQQTKEPQTLGRRDASDAGACLREIFEHAMQRAVLLLNLREVDGSNALALLVLLDIATFDDIAAAIGVTAEALAEIWSALPIDDLRIAEMFSLRRQQVINLRQAARQRLGRKLAR